MEAMAAAKLAAKKKPPEKVLHLILSWPLSKGERRALVWVR